MKLEMQIDHEFSLTDAELLKDFLYEAVQKFEIEAKMIIIEAVDVIITG